MSDRERHVTTGGGGVGIGSIIAAIISWTAWRSIPWAILHAMLGWVYVVYYFFKYGF